MQGGSDLQIHQLLYRGAVKLNAVQAAVSERAVLDSHAADFCSLPIIWLGLERQRKQSKLALEKSPPAQSHLPSPTPQFKKQTRNLAGLPVILDSDKTPHPGNHCLLQQHKGTKRLAIEQFTRSAVSSSRAASHCLCGLAPQEKRQANPELDPYCKTSTGAKLKGSLLQYIVLSCLCSGSGLA